VGAEPLALLARAKRGVHLVALVPARVALLLARAVHPIGRAGARRVHDRWARGRAVSPGGITGAPARQKNPREKQDSTTHEPSVPAAVPPCLRFIVNG
jgi:hypothetical protein